MFAERGGIKGQVDWVPIDQVVNAIGHLRQYRQDKVMQIYEVLGISDIMRGSSKASETAAAQQIKAQFGSTRIQLKQFYIADWITQALRIKAEIICKHARCTAGAACRSAAQGRGDERVPHQHRG
jgi:hypothetical protein